MKIFKWFWLLLKATILRKAHLKISFTKEANERWYVDFPNWPLSHDNLEMVAGADDLLNLLNEENPTPNHVSLEVFMKNPKEFDIKLKKVHSALTKGAFYIVETPLVGWENQKSIRRMKHILFV